MICSREGLSFTVHVSVKRMEEVLFLKKKKTKISAAKFVRTREDKASIAAICIVAQTSYGGTEETELTPKVIG